MSKRMIEGLKSLAIGLLACSALFLASQTALGQPIRDLLLPEQSAGGAQVYQRPADTAGVAYPVAMAAGIPGEGRSLLYGVQYDAAACDALFRQGAGLLAEALSSAGQPRRVDRREWQQALSSAPSLYFDFLGQIPLPALSAWLSAPDCSLTGSARRLALAVVEGEVHLYYQDPLTGAYYAGVAGVVDPDHLAQAVAGLTGNGAMFAFQGEEYAQLDPDTLLLEDAPQPETYQSANPITGDGQTLADLLPDLYFPTESTAFYSAGDEQVARNGSESLRLSRRGVLEYSCDPGGTGRYVIQTQSRSNTPEQGVEYCRYLAQGTLGRRAGQGRLYLSQVREGDRGELHIDFDYCLDGVQVKLEGGSAASFLVEEGRVTQFTLRFRRYTPLNSPSLVLPPRQAMAALEELGGEGRELRLLYPDQGGDTVTALWAAQEVR